jgi:hypothetical protein
MKLGEAEIASVPSTSDDKNPSAVGLADVASSSGVSDTSIAQG